MAPSSFPPEPVKTIDWNNVGFKVREVNGHIECKYTKTAGKWSEPQWVQDPYLRVHGMASGLNYGVQCYEGMKAYRSPKDDSIHIFRPDKNAVRMQHSAAFISVPPVPTALFLQCVELAVGLNAAYVPPHRSGAAMYIRPLLFASSAQLGLNPAEEYTFVVYVMPTGVYHGVHPVRGLVLEDFDRTAPRGSGSAKVGGNYAPVIRWSDKAHEEGYGITLHLDSQSRSEVDEFSTSAFIGVHGDGTTGKTTVVCTDSANVVASVTADSVLELARVWRWNVEIRPITYEEIGTFSEVMAAGTAASLVPIRSITMKSKGDMFTYQNDSEEPGPVVVALLNALKSAQQGKFPDRRGWLHVVKDPAAWLEKNGCVGEKTASGGC